MSQLMVNLFLDDENMLKNELKKNEPHDFIFEKQQDFNKNQVPTYTIIFYRSHVYCIKQPITVHMLQLIQISSALPSMTRVVKRG